MTKREMFTAIANVAEVASNPEMVEFLNHQIELLDNRKNSASKGLTKTQKEGLELMERIVEVLADAVDGMTATEVGDAVEVTCQRASALLKKLVEDKRVRKDKVGKQVRFFLA